MTNVEESKLFQIVSKLLVKLPSVTWRRNLSNFFCVNVSCRKDDDLIMVFHTPIDYRVF